MLYFNNEISLQKAYEINELFLNALNEVVIPIEGAKEILTYLHSKYKLVIATNGPTSAVKNKLEKIGCFKFIDAIFSADMTEAKISKPDTKYFEELEHSIDYYDKKRMLIIGDSLHSEIQGGMNTGIDSVWFNRLHEKLPNKYIPTYTIENLLELKDIL